MKKIIQSFFAQTINRINAYAEQEGNPYESFGIFGFISYPVFYAIWVATNLTGYENLTLRLIASVMCIPLIFKKKWPRKLIVFLPFYWYLTLLYCLPFMFTFLLLKNNFSYFWTLNVMTVLVLSVLLLDLVALVIVMSIGILLGWLCFVSANQVILPQDISGVIITYLAVIIFGAFFAHRKSIIRHEKIQAMKMLAGSIAHELRTPLRSISSGIGGIKKTLPALIQSYRLAKKADLDVPRINPYHYESLTTVCDTVESEARSAFTAIDVLLANVNHAEISSSDLVSCSISDCIQEAMLRYPFDQNESEIVKNGQVQDFTFLGQKLAVIHVLFNLMKNSLYHIRASSKKDAQILLSTSEDAENYYLHFKDTGTGISADALPYIFERFYSKTYHGAGIGLSFCKHVMEALGGKITCHSVEGQYAEFILKFPKNNKNIEYQGELS